MKLVRVSALVIACSLAVAALASAQTSTRPAQAQPPAVKAAPVAKAAPAARTVDPAAKLPKVILDAFKKAYPQAVIKAASEEKENGKTQWEVESTDNGLARDLIYNPDGTVAEFEEVVTEASLPPAVAAALKARYPKAAITKAEKLFKGKTTTFELAITGAGKVKAIEFTPEGKIVPAAAKAGEKDEKEDAAKPAVKKK